MERVKIKIETGVNYIGGSIAFKNGLPKNCIFDKGKVGCGGTTVAINSGSNYVIAVPFIALIENKVKQHDNIIAFYGGITIPSLKKSISETITNGKAVIIMVTYDSLGKVTDAIDEVITNGASKFKLLVDEYHILFTQYCFRSEAVNIVLENYKRYLEFCFMTATVLEDTFVLNALKDVPIVEAIWSNTVNVLINSYKYIGDVVNGISDLVINTLNNNSKSNIYIFINSVSIIKSIIELVNIGTEEDDLPFINRTNTNLIYSKNNKTELTIDRGELPTVRKGEVGYIEPKKINLITSTMFEGGDIYDENGIIYIVSDASKLHTLIDISTSFQQIAGRIRNSKYLGIVNHVYSNTRYTNIQTYEEFKTQSELDKADCIEFINDYNKLNEKTKRAFTGVNLVYVDKNVNSGFFEFNSDRITLDLYNFNITKHLYQLRVNVNTGEFYKKDVLSENLIKEYYKNGMAVSKYDVFTFKYTTSEKDIVEKFEDCVKELRDKNNSVNKEVEILSVCFSLSSFDTEEEARINAIHKKYPFLKEAIDVLGFEGIEDMKYIITNIKRKLIINNSDLNIDNKVFKLLNSYSKEKLVGSVVKLDELKELFKKVYKDLSLNISAKASDIIKYYSASLSNTTIGGKSVKVYRISNAKIIIG